MGVGMWQGVELIVNNDTTEEHHSDGKLMGHSQFVPTWTSTRQTPASWKGREMGKRFKKELEKELMFIEHLLGARHFPAGFHSVDKATESPEDEAIWPRSHTKKAVSQHSYSILWCWLLALSCDSISKGFLIRPECCWSGWLRLANNNGISQDSYL